MWCIIVTCQFKWGMQGTFNIWNSACIKLSYYTFNASLFWLAKSLQRIFKISAWRYNNYVKDAQGHGYSCHKWLQCMISMGNHVKFACFVLLGDLYIFTSLEINHQFHLLSWPFFLLIQCMMKQIFRFGFFDNQNNQGLSKGW